MGLIVEYNQVSVTDVESREMLACILSIKDILVDHKRSSLGVGGIASVVCMQDVMHSYQVKQIDTQIYSEIFVHNKLQ